MGASADKNLSKRSIAEQIIHNINSLNPAGRFLIEDPNANNGAVQKTGGVESNVNPNLFRKVWTVVDDEKAIEKVMHRLRERKKGDANATEEAETPPTNDNALKNDIDNGGDMGQQKLPPIDIGMHHNDEAREQTISPIDLKMLKNIEEQPFDDDFLSYFDIALDDNTAQRQAEESTNNYQQTTSLLQWVERSDMQSPKFIKMALQIALKLTECISEDEQGGHDNNMIPLDSINSDNVQLIIRSNGKEGGQSISVLMNSFGESSAVGALLDRLYALGVILYEIFSGEKLKGDDTSEIALAAETEAGNSKPRKRLSLTTLPTYMATLEGKGLPWSILLLLQSLLECRGHGEEIGDNAYTSFSDLKHDLFIMLADPSRFVDNIQVTSRLAFPTLEICDKLYGRENEIAKLDELYQQYIKTKAFKGVMISGMAGVGKSRLALHTQQQSIRCNGFFAMSKFESKQMSTTPLATIGSVFNTLCELLANGSTAIQLESIEKDLDSGLGRQAGLLAGVVPNLAMLLPSSANAYASSKVVNVAASMSYLFVKLLWVISIHSSRPITVLIDDIQFADPNSLILIGNLLQSATKGPSVFFVFCHRVDKDSQNEGFIGWQKSISNLSIECMRLDNLRVESVNSLVSETLHITPRITRSLSNILHHKSRGNALFLKQLIGSMYWKGYIFFEMTQPRWNWDLGKIAQYPISSSVLSLLMKTMKELRQLHSDLQLGLGVASCFGSSVKTDVLDMLSHGLGVDLAIILEKALEKGFMIKVDDEFHFVHDKIQQAGKWQQRCHSMIT